MTTGKGNIFEHIDEIRCEWNVPGLALSVVHKGKVVFCEGSGLRAVEQKLPVTPHTRFAIGSTTKAFTTVAMGILVDEGCLKWDTPVRRYFPEFRLFDPIASEQITLRDLVTHCSGLPRHDSLWYFANINRQELVRRVQHLEPSWGLRQVYQYNNLMFAIAGYLVEQVTGVTWEEFVTSRILRPLNMTDTTAGFHNARDFSDYALPYMEQNSSVIKIPFFTKEAIGPAGSIISSASDLVKWLLFHLNQGEIEGQQLVSQENLRQMHSPQMVIRDVGQLGMSDRLDTFPEFGPSFYGLGWRLNTYRGHNMIHHTGSIDGFNALVSFLPQDDIGVAILTNSYDTLLPYPLAFSICDQLMEMEPVPWFERVRQMSIEGKNEVKQDAPAVHGTQPSRSLLQEYAGDYEHPAYGVFSVVFQNDRLLAHFGEQTYPLEHYHYDVFTFTFSPHQIPLPVCFVGNSAGQIGSLTILLEPAVKEIVFTRKG